MSKRVLLTGVGGFIGAHVVQWILQNTDWDLVGIESWKPEHVNSAKRLQDVLAPLTADQRRRFTVHRWDLNRVSPYTSTGQARVAALASSVEHVIESQIPGAFVESGVWRGGSHD